MTEEEKRKALLDFMAAEQRRSPLSFNQDKINNIMRRTARQRELYASLARQGITWQQLKLAYDEEYAKGQSEMIRFRLSFFYGSLAVAFHEQTVFILYRADLCLPSSGRENDKRGGFKRKHCATVSYRNGC